MLMDIFVVFVVVVGLGFSVVLFLLYRLFRGFLFLFFFFFGGGGLFFNSFAFLCLFVFFL